MADLLQTGSDWLQSQRKAHTSQAVTYSRGEDEVVLNATIGKTEYQVSDENGFEVTCEAVDFLVTAADLILSGIITLPQQGDKISLTRGGIATVFEVMALAGQGHYRYSDSFGQTLRIHTKQVAE
mgnify:CR=1 FL=1